MKIITYSDLHLEFGLEFYPPAHSDADVMILAGDIFTFRDTAPLDRFLAEWEKPVIFVAGNHEYYHGHPMERAELDFQYWLAAHHPHVSFLQNEAVEIGGVHFFGGTMWTDFDQANQKAMINAMQQMNDYRCIKITEGKALTPADTLALHEAFVAALTAWFEQDLVGERVVISHHAPVFNPRTRHGDSLLRYAFNSLDMEPLIRQYQPALWVYGHTHECDDQRIGRTRILSNQLGYEDRRRGGFECIDFDRFGLLTEL